MSRFRRPAAALLGAVLVMACAAAPGNTQSRAPDASYRDAEMLLRAAARDTVGRGADPARLDTLGVALLRLARFEEATRVFGRVIDLDVGDAAANAGLGKMALFRDALTDADTLLSRALTRDRDPETVRDLYAARLREGRWADAAALAEEAGEAGRHDALLDAVEHSPCAITDGPDEDELPFVISYPVPCVRARIDGESVLLAVDTGVRGLLLDQSVARRARVRMSTGQTPQPWMARAVTATEASVPKLELGRFALADVPAGITNLHTYGLQLNPRSEPVAGVIGVAVLRAFTPTFDYRHGVLVLRRRSVRMTYVNGAIRVPFEIRGEADLYVHAVLAGARPMALEVHSGFPECAVAASDAVLSEAGLKPGGVSKVMGGASGFMKGNPWARVMVPSVAVGGVVQTNMPGWSLRVDEADLWRHGVRSDGYLSHDFFHGWRVTYDWPARSLVFEPKE
ncbi:MAG: aspartyl protease family protein [Candidatus Eisenbacteria bacterium]